MRRLTSARLIASGYAALWCLVPNRPALNAGDHAQRIEELAALDDPAAKPGAA